MDYCYAVRIDQPNVNSSQIMSDLRFMIEKRFADEGIVVAFPQPDVRLDALRPLRVELVPSVGAHEGESRKEPPVIP